MMLSNILAALQTQIKLVKCTAGGQEAAEEEVEEQVEEQIEETVTDETTEVTEEEVADSVEEQVIEDVCRMAGALLDGGDEDEVVAGRKPLTAVGKLLERAGR